jgi:hypothetical protein
MNQSRTSVNRLVAVAVLGVSTLVTTETANAQPRWGRPRTPTAGACFYRDPNFRGSYFCAGPGEDIAFVSGLMNNQISSIRMFGDTEVTIFQDQRFSGRWTRLEGNVRDLRREGWNDRLSSVRLSSGYGRNRGEYGDRRSGSGIGRIETGEWQDNRGDRGDRGDRRDGSGIGRIDPTDRRDGSGIGRYDPNDRRDSQGNIRTDPTDRRDGTVSGRRPGENADVIVRRVYQDVFQREPDAQGLALYRNNLNNENWSEQDVRNALVQSAEYRQRAAAVQQNQQNPQRLAEELVARAYRAVLGREPDPASRVYVDKVLRERWNEADVSRELRNSPEYRIKHPS